MVFCYESLEKEREGVCERECECFVKVRAGNLHCRLKGLERKSKEVEKRMVYFQWKDRQEGMFWSPEQTVREANLAT